MADQNSKNEKETVDNEVVKITRDIAVQHSSTDTGPSVSSQERVCTAMATSTIAKNAAGILFFLNSASTTQPSTSTTVKPAMYTNAVYVSQPVSAKLISQVQSVMSASKSTTSPENTVSDVVEKAMDLSNLGDISGDCSEHPATNAALTLVSLGSTVSQPVQEIVIDESGRSSFATNSNLDEVSVTIVESEETVPKSQGESPGLNTIVIDSLGANDCDLPLHSNDTPMREVVTQTGGGQAEVVILKAIKKAKNKSLSSYLTEQSLERKRRAEMKVGEAQKKALEKHRIHACDKCDKKFVAKHDLKRHMIVHSDERPFGCQLCDKAFRTKNELNLHIPVHNKDTPYKCEFCGKEFRTKGCFKSHIKYHIGDRRHKCTQCDKAFVKSADLKRHVAGHNNEKNFKCAECGSAFTRKDNLRAHMLLHSRDSVVTCDKCNKEFINRVYLKRHMHVHKQAKKKPYECQWCPKTYEQLEGLRRHIRQHVGDEKFVCEQCGKKFITAIQLKRHMWLCHEQTSPYRKSVL
ncbi:zinc finger protein 2 [Exaiptasia diaphana]|uniref:C2H2-type domain-containing protein n=1 Tax=Exaiptasia diaphana TaxID=2652724 RepID=A0A913X1C1_EXADI|nr:zinc finger protein 2 [Exaiptasia diaphana]KXJ16348.1 Zinc finger protein 26 [Exaiptasia diaphana]